MAQFAAVQAERIRECGIVSETGSGRAKTLALQADMYVLIAYLDDFEKKWPAATRYSHLFRRVLVM